MKHVMTAVLMLVPLGTMAQDLTGPLLFEGFGKSALERSEDIFESVPRQLDGFLKAGVAGTTYGTNEECLGMLQMIVNAAVLAANILPFSSVYTFEDERGPVARVRLMVNGEKSHGEAFCDGATLKVTEQPWGSGDTDPRPASGSSLDAALGMLLLGQMQGLFADDDTLAARTQVETAQPDVPEPTKTTVEKDGPKLPDETQTDRAETMTDLPIFAPPDRKFVDAPQDLEPMTAAEKDRLRFAIRACWNVPAGVREAEDLRITVGVELDPSGGIVDGTIRLLDPAELPDSRYEAAFRAARIALLRCAPYSNMPRDKYAQWRKIEMVFNPEGLVSW